MSVTTGFSPPPGERCCGWTGFCIVAGFALFAGACIVFGAMLIFEEAVRECLP